MDIASKLAARAEENRMSMPIRVLMRRVHFACVLATLAATASATLQDIDDMLHGALA